ncbi:MAG: fibronectin type III domain-containing protein [Actinomycetota bacterium]
MGRIGKVTLTLGAALGISSFLATAGGAASAPLSAYVPAFTYLLPAGIGTDAPFASGLATSSTGTTVYVATSRGGLYRFNAGGASLKVLRAPSSSTPRFYGVVLSKSGAMAYAASQTTSPNIYAIGVSGTPAGVTAPVASAQNSFAYGIAAAPDGMHLALAVGGALQVIPTSLGTPRTIALLSGSSALSVAYAPSGTALYFANGYDTISRVGSDGLGQHPIASVIGYPDLGSIDRLGRLYVGTHATSTPGGGQLLRLNADGSGRSQLATGFDEIHDPVVDATGSVTFLGTTYSANNNPNVLTLSRLVLRNLAPTGLHVTSVSRGAITLAWTRATAASVSFTVTSTTGVPKSCVTTGLSCTITGLTHGRATRFIATASNGFQTSPVSTATPLVTP